MSGLGAPARFALRLLPDAVAATESSGLVTFVSRRVTAQLMSIDLAPLAAGTLRGFVKEGRHQGLLDDILRGLRLLELTGLGGSGSRGYGKLRFAALACDGESLMDRLAAIEI